jgi:cytochrome c biogenesis protein ResB
VCFAPASVLAQDVGGILEASSFLAKNAPLDLTRLALQVAIISMLVNMVLIFAAFRIAAVWLRKPCLLTGEDGKRVLRSAVFEAVHQEKGK